MPVRSSIVRGALYSDNAAVQIAPMSHAIRSGAFMNSILKLICKHRFEPGSSHQRHLTGSAHTRHDLAPHWRSNFLFASADGIVPERPPQACKAPRLDAAAQAPSQLHVRWAVTVQLWV
jgi:hypothetical protein